MACPKCNREHARSKTGKCARCYMRAYRKTESGKANCKKANETYIKKNPEKRFKYVVHYREKVGYYIPVELWELRVACKRLERSLATAENGTPFREPSKRRRNQSIERRDRYGRSQNLRIAK